MSATLSASLTLAAIMKGVQPLSSCAMGQTPCWFVGLKKTHLGIRIKPLLANEQAHNLGVVVRDGPVNRQPAIVVLELGELWVGLGSRSVVLVSNG
jgi:hypothetical protein